MNLQKPQFKIWIDADACPKIIKEHIYNLAAKNKFDVVLVANSNQYLPPHPYLRFILVESGSDMADHYIVEHVEICDIVVTADIPLAAFIVKKGAIAVNVRGEIYTEENISERLSMRDFMKELRDGGVVTGGPSPFGPKDKELFANSINKILAQKLK